MNKTSGYAVRTEAELLTMGLGGVPAALQENRGIYQTKDAAISAARSQGREVRIALIYVTSAGSHRGAIVKVFGRTNRMIVKDLATLPIKC